MIVFFIFVTMGCMILPSYDLQNAAHLRLKRTSMCVMIRQEHTTLQLRSYNNYLRRWDLKQSNAGTFIDR